MQQQMVDIIQFLEMVRKRPRMYIGPHDPLPFLSGFDSACFALGLGEAVEEKRKRREEVIELHGLESRATSVKDIGTQLAEQGLDDAKIVDAVLAIEIEAWQRVRESLAQ